jgi:ABC-type glycerol-3-phosphate transport system substrate-binding protein
MPVNWRALRHVFRTAERVAIGIVAPVLMLALAASACGGADPEGAADRPATSTSGASTSAPGGATSTTGPRDPVPTTASSQVTGPGGTTPTTALGPEWTQQDGRVLIEAVASGDSQQLLADLVALGLTDGVVVGRLVNGWLPIGSFEAATQLGSLQFVQPTGAGTG